MLRNLVILFLTFASGAWGATYPGFVSIERGNLSCPGFVVRIPKLDAKVAPTYVLTAGHCNAFVGVVDEVKRDFVNAVDTQITVHGGGGLNVTVDRIAYVRANLLPLRNFGQFVEMDVGRDRDLAILEIRNPLSVFVSYGVRPLILASEPPSVGQMLRAYSPDYEEGAVEMSNPEWATMQGYRTGGARMYFGSCGTPLLEERERIVYGLFNAMYLDDLPQTVFFTRIWDLNGCFDEKRGFDYYAKDCPLNR